MNRLASLDYLRGLSAFGIMIFHYFNYTFGAFSADTFLCRLGTYGVGIFFVLSGLTLFLVYYDKFEAKKESLYDFFIKRVFRIFPLLWLATTATLIINNIKPDLYMLFLNLTGLFGFIKWDAYWAAGAWSIGDEIVFYSFFPLFVLFSKYNKNLMILLSTLITVIFLWFAFYKIESDKADYFVNYINPLNNLFLFLGGFLMGLFFRNMVVSKPAILAIFLISSSIFIYYPVTGDRINLLIGANRIIFTLSTFFLCFAFYKSTFSIPEFIHKPLSLLGEASYSVYLLHPIVYHTITKFKLFSFTNFYLILISIIITLIISYFSFQKFEKYFMKLSKKLTISA